MPSKKLIFRIAINTLIGFILVATWLHFVNIEEILTVLSGANFLNMIPILIFTIFTPAIRAVRLKILLSKIAEISIKDLIFLNGVALMLNFLIPIRAGEIAKAIYLNQTYQLPLGKSLAWIFFDRFLDFMFILIMAGGLLFFIPTSLPIIFAIGLLAAGLTVLALTYLMIFHMKLSNQLFKVIEYLLIFEWLKKYFQKIHTFFLDTISVLRLSPGKYLLIIGITIVSYLGDALVWYFAFAAVGQATSIIKMYLGQLLSALTYLIPAAPGYVGSTEASGLLILSGVFGYDQNISSAMIVLFHVCIIVGVLLYGLVSVYGLKIDLSAILSKALKRE